MEPIVEFKGKPKQPPPKPKKPIEVKAFKIAVVFPATELPTDCIPDPSQKIKLSFKCGDIVMTGKFNAKSYNKTLKKVVPGSYAIIQAKLAPKNELIEGGISLQPPKQEAAEAPMEPEAPKTE